jgi:hypothetical protein
VGIKKAGKRISETTVICHERKSMVAVTRIRLTTLLSTPDKEEVKAC